MKADSSSDHAMRTPHVSTQPQIYELAQKHTTESDSNDTATKIENSLAPTGGHRYREPWKIASYFWINNAAPYNRHFSAYTLIWHTRPWLAPIPIKVYHRNSTATPRSNSRKYNKLSLRFHRIPLDFLQLPEQPPKTDSRTHRPSNSQIFCPSTFLGSSSSPFSSLWRISTATHYGRINGHQYWPPLDVAPTIQQPSSVDYIVLESHFAALRLLCACVRTTSHRRLIKARISLTG